MAGNQELIISLRVSRLHSWQSRAWVNVDADWTSGETAKRVRGEMKICGVVIQRGRYAGRGCIKRAGQGTTHEGYGQCLAHGGAKTYGRAYGAVEMAYAFAEEYDLSPWESLLYVIRITAGRVRYCEQVLSGARDHEIEGKPDPLVEAGEKAPRTVVGGPNDGAPLGERDLRWWVETSERERVLLAKVSKAAIDAGVAQLLVEQELSAGRLLADSHIRVYRALEASGTLSAEALEVARQVMQSELAATGSVRGPGSTGQSNARAIEGEIKDDVR